MLVDRLAYHMTLNRIQNGQWEMFFSESAYSDDNELYAFMKKTPEWKEAQLIIRHWLKKQEK